MLSKIVLIVILAAIIKKLVDVAGEKGSESRAHAAESRSKATENINNAIDRIRTIIEKCRNHQALLLVGAGVIIVAVLAASISNDICLHEWREATCENPAYCIECGKTKGSAVGHDWMEATCTEGKKCLLCHAISGQGLGHDLDTWETAEMASCGDPGVEIAECQRCGENVERRLSATGNHEFGEWVVVCEVSCTQNGINNRTCGICGYVEEETVQCEGHVYTEAITKMATCGKAGVKTSTCTVCNSSVGTKIPATGQHEYGEWVTSLEPTCTVEGQIVRECRACGFEETAKIPMIEHEYIESIVTEATYTSAGTKGQKCISCDKATGELTDYYSFYETSLRDIFADYEINEIAAEEKYNSFANKMYIEFSAYISEIESDSGLFSYGAIRFLVNNGSWYEDEVTCSIKTLEQLEYVKSLSTGSYVTVRGRISSMTDYELFREMTVKIMEIY